ncbi:receptor-type tyrosine-protein phosphatase N2 [Pteronotus mesoamericanus]|uniref:receptor-type tyrosine-protein phosphatase N2 n=1 Tax=Pteronotus mesoamericanus TaxID=1884717 RepID=UPI0023ED39CA|nr:receptor-type tyrosine-protein phosphatase N2 [Pteronotus parnellii mesoamericanus]
MGPPLAPLAPLAPLFLLLLLLPPLLPAAPASLARPLPGLLGCLLEDGLCRLSETCVNDGVFGRCQKAPVTDTYRYEVSPGVLQHLTTTLQKLSRAGFTWQDDHTQHVLAQELSRLPRAHLRRPGAAYPARSLKPNTDNERRHRLESDLALAKALQRYLPYLEVLSQATAPDELPRTQQDGRPAQGEDPLTDSALTYVDQTSALTYAPASRDGRPVGHPPQPLSRPQPDELSPKGDGRVDKRNVLGQLMFYLAYRPPSPTKKGPLTPYDLMRMPWREPQKRLSPPEDPTDAPGLDDGTVLQDLLEALRQHGADVETLSPRDLDEVARVLADAVHDPWRGAEAQPTEPAHRPGVALFADGDEGRGGLRGNREQDSEAGAREEVSPVSLRPGHVLQDPGARPLPRGPPPVGSKKPEGPDASLSSEEDAAGVENVRSQTYSKELGERPPHWEPRVDGLGESPHWVPGAPQEDPRLGAGARGRAGDGLRLEVKSPGEDYGYVMTDSDPLSLQKGKELLEDVARLLKVPPSAITDTDVLGPAVTFRVSANVQNVTAADVAKAAVDNKDDLERASGLRILQAGVGAAHLSSSVPVRRTQLPDGEADPGKLGDAAAAGFPSRQPDGARASIPELPPQL